MTKRHFTQIHLTDLEAGVGQDTVNVICERNLVCRAMEENGDRDGDMMLVQS